MAKPVCATCGDYPEVCKWIGCHDSELQPLPVGPSHEEVKRLVGAARVAERRLRNLNWGVDADFILAALEPWRKQERR